MTEKLHGAFLSSVAVGVFNLSSRVAELVLGPGPWELALALAEMLGRRGWA